MREGYVRSISGVSIEEEKINSIARETIQDILSGLPEEAQTYDVVFYILRRAKEILKGMKVKS